MIGLIPKQYIKVPDTCLVSSFLGVSSAAQKQCLAVVWVTLVSEGGKGEVVNYQPHLGHNQM